MRSRKALGVLGRSARDGLSPLPVKEKAISRWTWCALAMDFPPASYRARRITRDRPKRTLFLDRHAGKVLFEDLACACDGLFPLHVEEKATRKALGVFSRSACDCLFPLPVEEKTISGLPRKALGLAETSKVGAKHNLSPLPVDEKGSMDPAETTKVGANIYFSLCLSRKRVLRDGLFRPPKCPRASEALKSSKTYQNRTVFPWTSASFRNRIIRVLAMDLACACDGWLSGHARDGLFPLPVEEKAISRLPGDARDRLFPLPVEEKAISRLPCIARDRLFPLPVEEKGSILSRKRAYHGLGVRLRWAFPPACRGKGPLMD